MPIKISHDHVAIRAVDYAGTVAWYRDKLDFTVDQEWPFGDMQLAYLSNGTAKIEILGGGAAEPHASIESLDATRRSPSFGRAVSKCSATPSTSRRSTAAWAS